MAESTYSSKASGEEDNNEGGMISLVGLGVASFSLADAQIPCVPSTANLEEQVDHDVERKRQQSRRKTKRFILSEDVDPLNQKITIVVATVAVLGLVFALTAMYIEMSMVATIAFFFPLMTAPYVIYQRAKIQRLPSFREMQNWMRQEVSRMAMQHNFLVNENNRLERQVTRLSQVEGRLEQILQREGKDVAFVKNLIFENGAILREMHKLQTAIELQDLFSAILRSDTDGDNHLSDSEMDDFLIRIKAFAATKKTGGRQQLTFDEERVRQAFRKSLRKMTVQSLINVTTSMMDDDEEKQAGGAGAAYEAMTIPKQNNPAAIVVTTVGDDESCMEPPTPPPQEGSSTNPVDVTDLV